MPADANPESVVVRSNDNGFSGGHATPYVGIVESKRAGPRSHRTRTRPTVYCDTLPLRCDVDHLWIMITGLRCELGIDVHDLGPRTEPIKAGMVFTIEPGIYIEEEQMGVRIENNFWITRNGNKDLMKNIPITVEDIEGLMKRKP